MLSSRDIAKKWETIAKTKADLTIGKCLLQGIPAGLYIALGALGFTAAQAYIGGGAGKLAGACVFPAGLMLVVMAGGELFTGNCLMAGPAANGKVPWTGVLRNWLFVYLGNMLGAFLLALIGHFSGLYGEQMAAASGAIAAGKCSQTFLQALVRGIGCNVLVCGAVWMASGADTAGGKAVCCFFPVMLFVFCGLEHSVANMFYVPMGMLTPGGVTLSDYLLRNLVPVTLGNIIGGAGLSILYAKVYKD